MLIITRKPGEKIAIGDDITVTVLDIKGGQIRIGIDAPRAVSIHRQEVYERIRQENRAAAAVDASDLNRAVSLFESTHIKGEKH